MPSKRTIRLVTPQGTTLEYSEEPPPSDSGRSGVRKAIIETTGEPISERPGIVKAPAAEPMRKAAV